MQHAFIRLQSKTHRLVAIVSVRSTHCPRKQQKNTPSHYFKQSSASLEVIRSSSWRYGFTLYNASSELTSRKLPLSVLQGLWKKSSRFLECTLLTWQIWLLTKKLNLLSAILFFKSRKSKKRADCRILKLVTPQVRLSSKLWKRSTKFSTLQRIKSLQSWLNALSVSRWDRESPQTKISQLSLLWRA